MPLIKACLFDLDGVIVDTAKYHYIAWKTMANDLGFDLTIEQNELLKGISRMESLDIILAIGKVTLSDAEKERRATEKNKLYLELCSRMTPDDALPGVRNFLDELAENHVPVGLGSASKNARTILQGIDMLRYFQTIVDGTRITRGKPDPQVFELGAADLGVAPEHCAVFEDAVAGIQSAKAAGMFAVGVGQPSVLTEADIVTPGFADFSWADLQQAAR